MMDGLDETYVTNLVTGGLTDRQISEELSRVFPGSRGFSERSIQRWRTERQLKKNFVLPDTEVERHVRDAVGNVGVSSGRRFVKGYLESRPNPVTICERRISKVLKDVYPGYHSQRRQRILQNLNPVPYRADYFGHRLHMDQNEKIAAFGITHVAAVNGFAGFVVSFETMPIKNNVTIYDSVFRPALMQYGVWDQIVVDHGGEFHLTLSGQDYYKAYRNNTARTPYIQITSTRNNRVERVWVEVNQRVNYPVKASLEHLVDQGAVDPGDDSHKFVVSMVGQTVTKSGITKLFDARNSRHCRGRGIPKRLMQENFGCGTLPAQVQVPTGDQAAVSYRTNGGTITDPHPFGADSLDGNPILQQQRTDALDSYRFSADEIYGLLACGNSAAFEGFVMYALDVDRRLAG